MYLIFLLHKKYKTQGVLHFPYKKRFVINTHDKFITKLIDFSKINKATFLFAYMLNQIDKSFHILILYFRLLIDIRMTKTYSPKNRMTKTKNNFNIFTMLRLGA
jgi:hypothetical protein